MLCGNPYLVADFYKARHSDDRSRAVPGRPPVGPMPGGVVGVKWNMGRTTQGTCAESVDRHMCFM